ncbi:MAG: GIY-YIG nuclease family protein [Candidatus Omnitrophota bacterium]|jgi:putative endonuclease
MSNWILYILKCSDGSLYTGITTDLEKRLKCHNEGKASKYTRSRLPVKLAYKSSLQDESSARKEEARIKGLSRKEKLDIIL